MRVRMLSPTGDYVFGQSLQNFFIDTPQAVGQAVQTYLLLIQGEWYLDNQAGTNYIGGIIGTQGQKTADAAVQDAILSVQGVTDISQYSSSVAPETGAFSVTATIDTVYGATTISVTLTL